MEKVLVNNKNFNEIPELDNFKIIPEILNSKSYKDSNIEIIDWLSYRDPKKTSVNDNLFLANIKHEENKYIGLLNVDLKRDHMGIHHYSNGDIFLGEWKDNYRNGVGVYLHNKPKIKGSQLIEIFMGKWKDDQPDHEGVYCWIDEPEKNDDFENCDFHAFVGELNDASFKRGIYLTKVGKKFFIYYGNFLNGKKNDEQCYFYDNDGIIDRVFRGKIVQNEVENGFFITFHKEEIDNTVYLKFANGKPKEIAEKTSMDSKIVKQIESECLNFREILFEDDWFSLIYTKVKESYKLISNFKYGDFNNENKFKEMVKIAASYKEIMLYPHLCEKLNK